MTLDQLLRQNIAGAQIFDPLSKQAGVSDWQYSGGGMDANGNPLELGIPDANKLAALQGYTFDWENTGPENTGTLTAYDPSGARVGSFNQQDQSMGSALAEFAALAAAGFGGVGMLGLGPLGGMLGGLGGAGSTAIGNGAFLGEAAAGGLGSAGTAGAGLGAGGAGMTAGGLGGAGTIAGSGMVAPTLGGSAGLGAGLGTAGGTAGTAAGAAGTGSFWGGLAKAAIGPAISTGVQLFAANKAAGAQRDATTQANNLQKYVYDTNRADNMPALQARNSALQQMQALLSDPSSLTTQPGYQFGLDQGTKTLQNGAAARGMTYSGAQGKALQRFGQDYAGTKLDQSFSRLSNLAQGGQPGANAVGSAATNYGNNVSNNLTAMGDANAAKYIVGGNAIGNAVNGLTAYGQRQGWWGG